LGVSRLLTAFNVARETQRTPGRGDCREWLPREQLVRGYIATRRFFSNNFAGGIVLIANQL